MSRNFNYLKKCDVFLGAAYTTSETNGERFGFYERISDILRNMGKRIFIPHRDISAGWGEKTYEILLERIMPFCDLFVGDIEIASQFTRNMACFAFRMEIPIVYLCRKGTEQDLRFPRRPVISFKNEEQGVNKINDYLRDFYEKNGFKRI